MRLFLPLAVVGLGLVYSPQSVAAQQYASQERSNAALGHYARARTMLVQALAEFEQGRKYARPDMLLDPEEWRLSVVSRTEELNRILDPRPRVTRDGVRFQANKLLIRRERDRLPAVADGAQDGSNYGEEQRKKGMRSARARLDQEGVLGKSQKKSARAKSAKNNSASKSSASRKEVQESAEEVLNKEESSKTSAADDSLVEAGKAAAKAKEGDDKILEKNTDGPIIEGEEEEVDSRAPLASERKLFGDDKPAAKPGAGKAILSEEKKEEEVSKAIEEALQERLSAEKPLVEKTEEEVLEDEIIRQ